MKAGNSLVIITYGMGVHWALNAAKEHKGSVEIVDLRTLYPMDEELVIERVKAHGKCLVLVEEQLMNSFAESVAGRISQRCFRYLDAPVFTMGAANMPAVPLNVGLEREMLPNKDKVSAKIAEILEY
jgi:2-oxoisovalerate dehydrogenase E1 component